MKQQFSIGGFGFEILSESDLNIPDMFRKFAVDLTDCEFSFFVSEVEKIPENLLESNTRVASRRDLLVGLSPEGENRLIGVKGEPGYYASYHEIGDHQADIQVQKDYSDKLIYDPVFTSLFALEKHMMLRNQFVLHCAYTEYQNEAVLFSAPSETGKTTQADLWHKYRGSRTVNGDRALLSFDENRLFASGWPVCGSSEVCENEQFPVKAIVMLSQGKENRIRRINGREAFTQLYSQLTINSWNQSFVNRALDFIEKILLTVPLFRLSCTISEEAVEVLENELRKINKLNR